MFVTTADPLLEPPLVTVNTVLSLLAVDYPPEKLACYVSDDGCSPVTFYSLVEASKFAQLWVPFCKKYNVQVRAPFRYFSAPKPPSPDDHNLSGFEQEWIKMKDEYEQLCGKIENAAHDLMVGPYSSSEYADFKNIERNNHPSIVKVIWENKKDQSSSLPHLVYISREKRPNYPHHYKAGALNVLTRVSGVMTNAPFMLNVDCDMFANNPKIILHGVCLLVGIKDEQDCAFVQCPQMFYNVLKDDPFGNQVAVPFAIFKAGMNGIQGPPYAGTGCFHRRKTIYGIPPNHHDVHINGTDSRIMEERFGKSTKFRESVVKILNGSGEKEHFPCDISGTIESACTVADCTYENSTCWGKEVGLMYGSASEDVLTGIRIHKMGWKSVMLTPNPPAFLGNAPPGGPISMIQMKRWGTGLLEVLFSKHFPIISVFTSQLHFRQALAYLSMLIWPLRSIPDFVYDILSAYCIITNSHFLPKVQEPVVYIPVSLFLIHNLNSLSQYLEYGETIRAWWNAQRMARILSVSSMLFATLSMIVKLFGYSETVFEITQKTQSDDDENDADKVARFTFDESPMFVPVTALLMLHLTALAIWLLGLQRPARGGDGGSGLGEIAGSMWVVLSFWPFVKGLFGKGKYVFSFSFLKNSRMAKAKAPTQLRLCERVSSKSIIRRTLDVTVFCLFLCLLSYRLNSLSSHGFTWLPLLAFLCESSFAFTWFLNLSTRWNPVEHKTYPENLLSRLNELPPVDMFVTTADSLLEPPLVTVNTVLSLLAVDYPPEKLACYVSDDGCSSVTFYSLVEASKFAQLWVPFCKKYNVQVRAPFQYFSAAKSPPPDDHNLSGFKQEWIKMKDEYEQLCGKIENAAHASSEYADFKNIDRNNHPSLVKVIWENKKDQSSSLPHLVYISREKRPNYLHHYKAGAMNVLTRVSGVMTNAPFMLNVDCDMFANNPKIILHGVCLLVGIKDEQDCAFVQCLQIFYNVLKDDPFGNQVTVPLAIFGGGMAGIQGPSYSGTGCFHRRKTIYGIPPNHDDHINGTDSRILEERFGKSTKFRESVVKILNGSGEKEEHFPCDISGTIESACRVADSTYENSTCWGTEVGLLYGSATEDALTGLRIHEMGWKSVMLIPNPPGFLGNAPPGGPIAMTQMKRWGTGLLEILFSKHFPIVSVFTSQLHFRQALAYLYMLTWALRSIPEFVYVILPSYCIITNSHLLPKVQEPVVYIPVSLFLIHNLNSLSQYLKYGQTIRAWWNAQRMARIIAVSSLLFATLSMIVKLFGYSETVFEITQKIQSDDDENDADKVAGRFTFDESPMFVPVTALLMLHLTALAIWLLGLQPPPARGGDSGSGLVEILCSVWVVLSFWPFVKGLFGHGKYGIPLTTIFKSAALVLLFVPLCLRISTD
ncbi:Cellulose synthase [Corchorus olitorius]|uniref:Cellulose synthase n=1 Tax=Corchorus olitorius TaxID=93759 RepID=A0A1R3KMK3_9ROSI|nr:Cellulose synthase [Corchorus olitorius]